MTSHTHWIAALTFAVVQLMGGVALAQSSSSETTPNQIDVPAPGVNPTVPSDITPRSPQFTEPSQPQQAPQTQETITTCGPGQFLSVFSDVRPDHWAYEAVNRIASGEPRCFPLTPQS